MSPPTPAHRDRGLRKVSLVTRLTAAGAAAAMAGLAVYVGSIVPGGSAGARTTPATAATTPTPTRPPVATGPSAPGATVGTTTPPATNPPPVVVPVQPHTRTRGS